MHGSSPALPPLGADRNALDERRGVADMPLTRRGEAIFERLPEPRPA